MRTERIRETSFACLLVFGLKSHRRATLSHSDPGLSPSLSAKKASSDALQVGDQRRMWMRHDITQISQQFPQRQICLSQTWTLNHNSSITWIAPVHKTHKETMHFPTNHTPRLSLIQNVSYLMSLSSIYVTIKYKYKKNPKTKSGLQRQTSNFSLGACVR